MAKLDRPAVVYYYDGSFAGLLACIYESYSAHELPMDILPWEGGQMQLLQAKHIRTHAEKTRRVRQGICDRCGRQAFEFLRRAFLTCLDKKELRLLYFARLCFARGREVLRLRTHPAVLPLADAVTHMRRERELLLGFLRFSEYRGVLVSEITPKNRILPLLSAHFCDRFHGEALLIFDKTHKEALLYANGRREFRRMEALRLPELREEEAAWQALWREFYQAIGIRERENPTCRRSHMPKRYWRNMTEFSAPELSGKLPVQEIREKMLAAEQRAFLRRGAPGVPAKTKKSL